MQRIRSEYEARGEGGEGACSLCNNKHSYPDILRTSGLSLGGGPDGPPLCYLEGAVNQGLVQVDHHTLFAVVRYRHLW